MTDYLSKLPVSYRKQLLNVSKKNKTFEKFLNISRKNNINLFDKNKDAKKEDGHIHEQLPLDFDSAVDNRASNEKVPTPDAHVESKEEKTRKEKPFSGGWSSWLGSWFSGKIFAGYARKK